MNCTNYNFANRSYVKFCENCGNALSICPRMVRLFRAFLWLRVFSAPEQNPRPAQRQAPRTQTVTLSPTFSLFQNRHSEKLHGQGLSTLCII